MPMVVVHEVLDVPVAGVGVIVAEAGVLQIAGRIQKHFVGILVMIL